MRVKFLVESGRNSLPIVVRTCSLHGALKHIIFRFLILLLLGSGLISYFSSFLGPLLHMASSYSGSALENSSWLHERVRRRFAYIIGNCFLILRAVGWIDCAHTVGSY